MESYSLLSLVPNREKIVTNRRNSLEFTSPQSECQTLIDHLIKYENNDINKKIENSKNWQEWVFEVDLSGGGKVKLNVLHVAIIMKNKPVIDFILKQDDSDIKYFVGKSVQGNKAEDRFEEDDWIYGATSLHLAARFFHDVMFKLIEVNKELVNNQENDLKLSPLHITAIVEFHIGTRMLLMKGAEVDAVDNEGRTPLYFAARSDNYLDVVTLVEEGGADIFKTDLSNKGPYDVAKSTDILKFLFSKTTVAQLVKADPEIKLYDKVVENHPNLIEPFLNIFISVNGNIDLDSPETKFEYNLSLFTTGNSKKRKTYNMMHRHLRLIDTKNPDMLLHPVMRAFTDLKWMQFMGLFLAVIFCVFVFLICFSFYGMWYVDVTQCENLNLGGLKPEDAPIEDNCAYGYKGILICTTETDFEAAEAAKNNNKVEDATKLLRCNNLRTCKKGAWRTDESKRADNFNLIVECLKTSENACKDEDMVKDIQNGIYKLEWARWLTIFTLIILMGIEVIQILAKSFKKRLWSYFSFQNIVEICIMITTVVFLWIAPTDIEWAGHIGGWTLFFGWMNFTAYLCQISSVGKAIYSSIYVTKKIMKTLVVFVPSLIGFTCGFHFFLHGNQQFHEFRAAFLKVLIMMLGEYDYEDNFAWTVVYGFGGRNYSLHFLFVLFTIYGSVIVMNLLVALMINHMNMDEAESLLQTHRVEEISDKIELATINKMLRKICCSSCPEYQVPVEDPTSMTMIENGQLVDTFPMMKVRKEEQDDEESKCCCTSPSLMDLLLKFLGRKPIEMENTSLKKCKLITKGKAVVLTVSTDVVDSTLETLRRKREDYLKMVREIKKIQWQGADRMAKFSK